MRTLAGRDWQCRVMADPGSDASGDHAPANYIGLSSSAVAPSASNTSLADEITTGTLARAQASFAHTDGTASYTLVKTFTSDQVVTLRKYGVFNAASDGVMAFENVFDGPVAAQIGDTFQVVDTITL